MNKRSHDPPDTCDIHVVHPGKIASIRKRIETASVLTDLADLFKTLADPTRVRILNALSLDELCVCDIAGLLGATQSAVSHQLRVLRMARLVKYRRSGKMAYYSLDDDHVRSLIIDGLEHVNEIPQRRQPHAPKRVRQLARPQPRA
jgi:DNA-binding transcriptional ArsR family regulator